MGGLECTVDAECIDKSGKVIPGLYVAGEAAGGIHGNNRLGGNSLLDPGFFKVFFSFHSDWFTLPLILWTGTCQVFVLQYIIYV